MITYKITPIFVPEWEALFAALFPGKQHDASVINPTEAYFSFIDPTVTPVDLGPLVRVELLPSP
jgi:hypothetical protein